MCDESKGTSEPCHYGGPDDISRVIKTYSYPLHPDNLKSVAEDLMKGAVVMIGKNWYVAVHKDELPGKEVLMKRKKVKRILAPVIVNGTPYCVIYIKGKKNWGACSPQVPGCISTGKTLKKVERNYKEALEFHLEGLEKERKEKGNG